MFGGNPIAVAGKLVFAIGGPKEASEAVKPLIQDVMGRKIIDCGEEATKSSLLKIAGYVLSLDLYSMRHAHLMVLFFPGILSQSALWKQSVKLKSSQRKPV